MFSLFKHLCMGHSDLSVLRRYLKQMNDDLKEAHIRGGPVDRLM